MPHSSKSPVEDQEAKIAKTNSSLIFEFVIMELELVQFTITFVLRTS